MAEVNVGGGLTRDNAILLLAAVEELGEDPSVVRTTMYGFVAPEKVAKQAGVDYVKADAEVEPVEQDDVVDEGVIVPTAPPVEVAQPEAVPEVEDDLQSVLQQAEDEATNEGNGPEVEEPKKTANKPEWVEFAVSKGADREVAQDATKNDLIEQYGTKE